MIPQAEFVKRIASQLQKALRNIRKICEEQITNEKKKNQNGRKGKEKKTESEMTKSASSPDEHYDSQSSSAKSLNAENLEQALTHFIVHHRQKIKVQYPSFSQSQIACVSMSCWKKMTKQQKTQYFEAMKSNDDEQKSLPFPGEKTIINEHLKQLESAKKSNKKKEKAEEKKNGGNDQQYKGNSESLKSIDQFSESLLLIPFQKSYEEKNERIKQAKNPHKGDNAEGLIHEKYPQLEREIQKKEESEKGKVQDETHGNPDDSMEMNLSSKSQQSRLDIILQLEDEDRFTVSEPTISQTTNKRNMM